MTLRVAGTEIADAIDDDRTRTILVSDLHVPRDGGDVAAAFATVCAEARREPDRTRLLVLGDLFEFYLSVRQLELGAWADVAAAIRSTVDAGVPVTVLHGNRDFLLDRRFEARTGARVVSGGLRCRLGGTTLFAMHGDEFCLHDTAYQRAKRVLRHPVTRWIARNLPLSMALRAGGRARDKSETHLASSDDDRRFDPVAPAVGEVYDAGADVLVFGHIHRPARGRFADRGEYFILPAFDETGVFLEAEGAELRYRSTDREVPDYAPREFA